MRKLRVFNSLSLDGYFTDAKDDMSWAHRRDKEWLDFSTVRQLKAQPGPDIMILGSGSLVSDLTHARLIDGYQIVVTPVIIGQGRTIFETVRD